jgi:hypothetical protein
MRPCGVSQWCHGYGPASNKAQGSARITSSLLRNALAKAAIGACSRGRKSCIVHTPDKARLIERSPEGNRRAIKSTIGRRDAHWRTRKNV